MNKKLEDKLKKKYPALLTKLEKKDPEYSCYDRDGVCIGDGWYELFDRTLGQIQYYNDNPPWVEERWAWIKTLYINLMWNPIIYQLIKIFPDNIFCKLQTWLSVDIKQVRVKNHEKIRLKQVKQKFGKMRIYVNYYIPYIHGILSISESVSGMICERCGTTTGVTTNSKGWMNTLCHSCRKQEIKS